MRVNPFYVTNLAGALNTSQANEQQLTLQLSSGARVNALSDDPLAAGENVQLLNQIQRDDSFTQTSSLVQGKLQVADSTMGSVVTQLNQAIQLATSGNNGPQNANDLQSISSQLAGIRDEVVSLANTAYQGQYIFAGSVTGSVPFATSTATSPAVTTYGGDSVVNFLVTPNGQKIQLNVPGNKIFASTTGTNVLGVLNQLIADFASGSATGSAAADTTALTSALNLVSQQRVTIDNSLTRLTAATDAVSSEKVQLTAAQTNLMQADVANLAAQLSLDKTQQAALESVMSQVGSGSLFDKL